MIEATPAPGAATAPLGAIAARGTRAALALLVVGALCISFSGIFVRLSEVGPMATGFYRLAIALPVLWLIMGWERRGGGRAPAASPVGVAGLGHGKRTQWLVLAGVFFAFDIAIWNQSVHFTTVANATLLANTAPIFVTLGAWLVLGQRCTRAFIVGLAVAFAGMAVLMGDSLRLSSENFLGDGLSVVAAVVWGAYILAVARLRPHLSTATIMTWTAAIGAAVTAAGALAAGETVLPATAYGWGVLAAFALVAQIAGQGLIAFALAHLPAAFSSVGLMVQPVAAAVFAWVLLGEGLGAWQAVGGTIVLAGVVLARRASRGPAPVSQG